MNAAVSPEEFERLAETPVAIVDVAQLERNLNRVAEMAAIAGVAMRPHVKTHKSPRIARRQLELGAVGVTCATLDEATAMISAGVDDVLVYYPIVGERALGRLLDLEAKATVAATVEGGDSMARLDAAARRRGRTLDVLIDVDSGLGRTGAAPAEVDAVAQELERCVGLNLVGVATHEGFSYSLRDAGERDQVVTERLQELVEIGRRLGVPRISCGSTPSIETALGVDGITEIRPGNYVFLDRIQVDLGVADPADCALSILSTVISVRDSERAIVDAGSKALTSDLGAHGMGGLAGYGLIRSHPDMVITALSEEHGFIDTKGTLLDVGRRFDIVPNHACACASAMGAFAFVEGSGVSVEPMAGRRGERR